MKRFILLCAVVVTACNSGSASTRRQYTVYGYGTASCGTWAKDEGWDRAANRAWVLGFMSGAGWDGHEMRGSDRDGIVAAMDKHCQEFPTHSIAEAAAAVAELLEKR